MKKTTFTFKISLFFLSLILCCQYSFGQTTKIYTATGSGSFTIPTGVTSITIEAWGGGGKGGARTSNGPAGGGAGGAYSKHTMTVTSGTTYSLNVGVGSSSTATTTTSDSWFSSTSTMIAKGGASVTNDNNNGASGTATGSIGNVLVRAGGNGANGISNTYGGGGGSSASANGTAISATNATGATAPTDGGNGGNGFTSASTSGSGTAGAVYGGGGGGAIRYSNTGTSTGGNGANGKIIITYGIAEINVFSSYGTNLADGDTTPTTDKGTLFGSVNTGSFLTSEFIIMNTGNVALTLGTPTFSGTNASEFTVLTSPGTSIAAGSTATMVIKFLPTAITPSATRTATISFTNNDADENPFNFSLQGTATAPAITVTGGPSTPTNIPNNDATPSTAKGSDFGTQVAAGSVTKTFTITNSGTGLLTITGVTLSGAHASDFSVVKSPSTTVAVGASTTFSIKFDPSSGTVRNATVNIACDAAAFKFDIKGSNDTSTAADISIYSSTPTEVPMYAAASSTYNTDFGSVNTLDTPVTKTFTIKNDSATLLQTLTGVSVSVTGTGFSVSSTTILLGAIGPGGSATFNIQFDPTTTGTVTGIVTVASSDANEGSYSFYVTGTGTNPEFDLYGGDAPTLMIDNGAVATYGTTYGTNFGTQNSTTGYLTRTYTLKNTGNGPLVISSVSNSNTTDYSISAIASPIAAGASTTFTITFNPAATGTKTAIITINNNDPSESAFKINLTGSGSSTSAGEISVKGGSPLTEIFINDAPTTAKGTDFGGIYVISGTISKTFTIYNTGASTLSVSTPVISGTGASDFTVTANPTSPVAITSGSTTFTITFNPSATGTRSALVSITNGDPNESPFTFYIEGSGNTYADSDYDGVTDDADIDDDNDGILDTLEQAACSALTTSTTSAKTFLNETFGTGASRSTINTNNPDAGTTYNYGTSSLDDGDYTVYNSAQITTWANEYWYRGTDHTGDTNGKMAMFNANFTPEKFYTNNISGISPNVEVTFGFYAINLDRTDATDVANRIRPNIRVEIRKVSDNTLITSLSTGNIDPSPSGTAVIADWKNYTLTFTTSETEFNVTFVNNAPGGLGNDIAIDDITVSQKYCDMDHDNEPDVVDLDDDNDGIPDVVEAGFKALSNNKSVMDISDSTLWKDVNENGLNDSADPTLISNYYTAYVPDSDGDGIYDFMDLDSDNDTIFDIDEGQKDGYYVSNTYGSYNGDGDVDGDGRGDGVDTDGDGILDLNDDSSAYGSTYKAYPTNTDGDSLPDYLDLTSNGSTKDIAGTLYASLDANSDGKIDGSTDVDKDGIIDAFDTINLVDPLQRTKSVGSPRDLTNKTYLIDFDGRNDYAEGDYLFSNASTTSKATMMGWIKLDANYPTTDGVVMGQDKFYIYVTGSATKKVTVTAGSYSASWTTALDVSRWYHVAASFDSSSALKLYVNGTLVATTAVSASIPANTYKFTLAKKPGATAGLVASNHFRGYIDEVRVFNTALTDDQIQKMVYQKISQNGTAIRGAIVPKDIESSTWTSLKAYYRMDDYKGNVADDYTISGTDNSTFDATSTAFLRIYNVKYIKTENAPLPFITKQTGALNSTSLTDATNFIYGPDVTANNFSIIQVKHDVTLGNDLTNLGLIIDSGKTVSVNNDNKIENSWYLELNGKIDLVGKSQLIQGANSTSTIGTSGTLERDQQGTSNKFNYNYWSSPVSSSSLNGGYTIKGVMKDGTTASNPQTLNWTSSNDGDFSTSPITVSNQWLFKFQNVTNTYANWTQIDENTSLLTGMGYTMKGGTTPGSASKNYVFVGKPNNGTITVPISAGNLNLTGNPYPSAIDAWQFITDNVAGGVGTISNTIEGSLYFWQHLDTNNTHILSEYKGGYAARNLVGAVGIVAPAGVNGLGSGSYPPPGQYLPVGQGFFVVGINSGNVTFKNSQRTFKKETDTDASYMLRTSAPENAAQSAASEPEHFTKIRIGFNTNENFHRAILIGFMNEHATDAIENGYDTEVYDEYPEDMTFRADNRNLIIEGVGAFSTSGIYPLFVKTATTGNVKFTLDETEYFDGVDALIYDSATNEYYNISEGIAELTLEAGTYTDRFSLRFQESTLGIENPTTQDGVKVIYASKTSILTIENNVLGTNVEAAGLFNMIGQQINNWDLTNKNQQKIEIPIDGISAGTYIVKIKTNNGSLAKKVVIK